MKFTFSGDTFPCLCFGYSTDDIAAAYQTPQPVKVTRVRQRQAMRGGLDMRVRTEAGRILGERGVNPQGSELDRRRLGRTNLIVMKAAIDRQVNALAGQGAGQRHEFSREVLDRIDEGFEDILAAAVIEVFDGNSIACHPRRSRHRRQGS